MRVLLVVLILSVASAAFAIDDSPANRLRQADRYLEATPPADLMADMADKVAMNLPPEKRGEFKDLMTKYLDIQAMTEAIKEAMIRNFTAEELQAMADFYGSPVGQSSMKKFGTYMAEVMPLVQAEVVKAYGETIKAQAELNRQKTDAGE